MTDDRPGPAYPEVRPPRTGAGARILPAGVELSVRPGESIVDAVRRHGYRIRYSCRRGGCGACKADLVEGAVRYPVPIASSVLSDAERASGKCLPCRAEPVGNVVIRLSGRNQLRRVFEFIHPASGTAG